MTDSTRKKSCSKSVSSRPKKPYKAFPLTPHPGGTWQKKILGKIHYFGRWGRRRNGKVEQLPGESWQEALALYKLQAEDLHAGRTPQLVNEDELSLKRLCNLFLTSKQRLVESDELSPRTLAEYRFTTDRLIIAFGKNRVVCNLNAQDFSRLRNSIAKTCGPVRLGNEIVRCKSVFKFAIDNTLIDQPVAFGSDFRKPSTKVMRKHKAESEKKLFEAGEIVKLLGIAGPQLKAAILLGINCGYGNTDVSSLVHSRIDLDSGWATFARTKTGIARRSPLWPETIEAIRAAIAIRPEPKSDADKGIVLLTVRGERLVRITEKSRTDSVTSVFAKLLSDLEINGRKGLGFYSLRHTFATIGLEQADRDAMKSLMGHAAGDILANYEQAGPSDARLTAITDHVRSWLLAATEGGALCLRAQSISFGFA